MADSMFRVSVNWEGSLEQDFDDHIPRIRDAASMALHSCESVMYASLQEHIQKDWHDAWFPLVYKRRTDFPKYRVPGDGEPLGSEEYMDSRVNGLSLTFSYFPKANHKVRNWANHRDGDKLIESIQLGSEGGEWTWYPKYDPMPPRPFWNNFVEEQRSGMLFAAFENGFGRRGYDLVREGGQKDLDFPASESMLAGGIDDGAMGDDERLDSLGDW